LKVLLILSTSSSTLLYQVLPLGGGRPDALSAGGYPGADGGPGLVVPQVEVLAHAATGGFLTHCGWNSLLESFVHGVPMIAWPLYAEQRMDAVMMADSLGVALRPKTAADGSGLVRRDEVARELMEGQAGRKAREKVGELKQPAAQAVAAKDGSSCNALAKVAQYWKDNASGDCVCYARVMPDGCMRYGSCTITQYLICFFLVNDYSTHLN
ncbi:hypothetical protein B296_00056395, partial [Ensete ventricosum]